MLKGKKTYITGVMGVLTAVAAYLTGDASVIDATQLAITSLLGMFVRAGIAK